VAAAEVGTTGTRTSLRTWKTKKIPLGGKVLLRWAEEWRASTTILILVPPEAASATGMVRTEGAAAVDRISEARTSPLEAVALGHSATLTTLSKEILDEAKTPEVVVASNRTGSLRGGSTTWNLRKIAINVVTSVGHTSKTATPGVV
jgi:hypothetical protein